MLPTAADIAEAIQASEREENERETWLRSPAAKQEREQSRLAFADLGAASAQEILNTVFGSQLTQLNADPARALADAQLLALRDEADATVIEDGETKVLESSIPLRTEEEDGALGKVDLSLEPTAEGFETKNALVDVKIPASAERSVEVGERGVSIKLAGASAGRALEPFGEQNALASEVLTDTDMLVSPIASGVEIFNLLRSELSPETVRFQVSMPPGAVLRAGDGQGAEVVKEGEPLATIPEPVAVDAQGTDVPVALQIEGDILALTVRHREGDYAMPILLDPAIAEDNGGWVYGQNLDALHESIWGFTKNVAGIHGGTHCIYHCWGLSNPRGLFVSGQSGTYWPNQYGHWFYAAPNVHSYISGANFHPFVRYDHGCNAATTQYKQPHDYVGLWTGSGWAMKHVNFANHPAGGPTVTGVGQSVVMGLSTANSIFSIPCWRDLYLQGAYVTLDDWGPPVINSVSGIPSGWFSDETQVTITPNVIDEGLGIQLVKLLQTGKGIIDQDTVGYCTGTRRSLCPTSRAKALKSTGHSFGEGIREASVAAYDPTGEDDHHHFTTKVDKSKPEVALEGQLATATGEEVGYGEGENPVGEGEDKLSLPVYKLRIKAKDGSTDKDENKRSGVRDIRLLLDGEEKEDVPWEPIASCPQTSCQMDVTYTLKLSEIDTAGKHTLEVIAEDFVGKEKKRQIEFEYFPATGMKDEYVMHYFPLPNGQGDEESEEHPARPELAVNVMNGNLVYRERDIDVEGPAVDLEVERYYNSQLPASEDTEWGDGWTLAQTPDLEPEQGAGPPEAELVESSGAIEAEVELPTEAGEERFDPELQATLEKKEGGGYELTDETGESATSVSFNEAGRTEALLTDGFAKVNYGYEEGDLARMTVEDPGSGGATRSATSAYWHAIGSAGAGEGQFNLPVGAAADAEGNVWVADTFNNRIQKLGPGGEYLDGFGQAGSGTGQFDNPCGLAIDPGGNLWVTDLFNNRLQKWQPPSSWHAIGSAGAGEGQFNLPVGAAADAEGNVWVADTFNNRIQKLGPGGEYLDGFGQAGSGPGQLSAPYGLALDAQGDIWVADTANNRIQQFSPHGEYLSGFGEEGSGDGQFKTPTRIAFDQAGDLWVTDADNDRLQKFSPQGEYLDQLGEEGSGEGQFDNPAGIAIDADGEILVVDRFNNRIQRFDADGEYLDQFGQAGSGPGGLNIPVDLAIDPDGDLWVTDTGNASIEKFSPEGAYLGRFGQAGSGTGQFDNPCGLAIDPGGNLWVTDLFNNRLQKWQPGLRELQEEAISASVDNPEVSVQTSAGLVEEVVGEETGEHAYEHDGELLTAHDGPLGETEYEYDEDDRLSKVTLPNGTWASIAYDAAGRAKVVSVSIEGAEAKATHFTYKDESPRRTTVEPPDAPHVVYDIGDDGSVLKWWNTLVPPELDLSGSLYDNREEDGALWAGDHILDAEALSEEGIDSIEVIAGDTTAVDEMTCEQDFEVEGKECKKVINEWVTETGFHAPGHLQIEVIATDALSQGTGTPEHETAERFWVDIPEPPPPPAPGTPIAPKFQEIADFREDYGLEVVFPVANEIELNERIFNLIKAWHEPGTPAGQVARASWERWGVPLRSADVAEMEFREAYVAQAADVIPQWVEASALSSYAGYYVDHRAGGTLHVGFTQNQASLVQQLKAGVSMLAPDRVGPFPYQPGRTLDDLRSLRSSVAEAATSPSSPPQMFAVDLSVKDNGLSVSTAEVVQTSTFLTETLGPASGVHATYQPTAAEQFSGRYHARVPFLAGMELHSGTGLGACTAGFGAWGRIGTKPTGQPLRQRYALTSGHCYTGSFESAGSVFFRSRSFNEYEFDFPIGRAIGKVTRRGYLGNPNLFDTDALAISLYSPDFVPGWVYQCCGGKAAMRPRTPTFPSEGQVLCHSSRKLDKIACGPVTNLDVLQRSIDSGSGQLSGWQWLIRVAAAGEKGDSGSPVWVRDTGQAVGLIQGGGPEGLLVTPLKRPPHVPPGQVAGILTDPHLSPSHKPLHLQIGR
jgi:YD repeat-containing protein